METHYTKSARIVAILQLCLAFSLILWLMGYPFMGRLFATKSKKELVLTVMGDERYEALPQHQRITIDRYLDDLNSTLKHTFFKRLVRSVHIIAFEISPIEQMWIIFSILTPLLILLNIELAKQVALALPLIAFCFSLDNYWNGFSELNKEARLFPSEEYIVSNYLERPLSGSIAEQRKSLSHGWQSYLIDKWAQEAPSSDIEARKEQIAKGEYRFQVERVLAQATQNPRFETFTFKRKQPLIVLILYCVWNLFFAWFANRERHEKRWLKI